MLLYTAEAENAFHMRVSEVFMFSVKLPFLEIWMYHWEFLLTAGMLKWK